jgi:leucine dehydrogenase
MFDHPSFDAHEGVHSFFDAESGLRAIIAVHSTVRGPAAGGCRMWPYADGAAMLTDALRLAQGMSYKNAMAGLDLGGGKAVVWGNPRTDKSEALFKALGRAVHSLNGQYYTAEDVGITPQDMSIVRSVTPFVAGLPEGPAASGDPSPVTALGVFEGIKTVAERLFGTSDLNGRTISVQGVGHVGGYVCKHLAQAGAKLIICDIDAVSLAQIAEATGAKIVPPDAIYDADADIFSPNALGAILNENTLPRLKVKGIAGGANNQLATPDIGAKLLQRGVLYAPDYVINGGGIINVAAEIRAVSAGEGYDRTWVEAKLSALVHTLAQVLDTALSEGIAPHEVANHMAKTRIAEARSGA